jgi:hypothetical protein
MKNPKQDFARMNVDTTYPLGIAALAAQITPRKFRRWSETVMPLRSNDVKAEGSGIYCGWSRNRVLQAATIQDLTKAGASLSDAALAALQFSDQSNLTRPAGEIYPMGKSYLVVGSDSPATVVNADFDLRVSDLASRGSSVIIVDLNAIVDQVDAVLNKH